MFAIATRGNHIDHVWDSEEGRPFDLFAAGLCEPAVSQVGLAAHLYFGMKASPNTVSSYDFTNSSEGNSMLLTPLDELKLKVAEAEEA